MEACHRIVMLTGALAAPISSSPPTATSVASLSPMPFTSPCFVCPPGAARYGSHQFRKKCARQGVDAMNVTNCHQFHDTEGRLAAEFGWGASSSSKQHFRSRFSFSKRPCIPPRAEAENGALEADDHDYSSPLSSDNGVSLFDYNSLHMIGSPSPDDGGASLGSSIVTGAAASNRAGLYRTPISGGVQTATSSHGLPHPAIAVRNLIEQARYAHLCTIMSRMHHRRRGYPFGSLVEFAADSTGHPIFSLSPLAIHTRNLLADPRCTLVVQVPGWSGLANARVTLFGDVYPLPVEQQELAHKYYTLKHQHGASQQWGNFNYYRMETISDVYFVGGFGTVAWVEVNEYENALPDIIVANGSEKTLQELNIRFSKPLREVLSMEAEVDDAALISIDSKGVDIRVRQGAQFNVQRLPFQEDQGVETLEHAVMALKKVLDDDSKFSHKL